MTEPSQPLYPRVNAKIYPRGGLDLLSRAEVAQLRDATAGGMHDLLRRCSLAVLTSGAANDDPEAWEAAYADFDIQVLQHDRGPRIDLFNAPAAAFVEGKIISGVAELLFAVVRDLAHTSLQNHSTAEATGTAATSAGRTDGVFALLRNARILQPREPNLVVCWGGHSINTTEYDYTKRVGYEMGLRGLDIATGCGPGAMKGPMKGAAIAHVKQRHRHPRYIGLSEPGIIAAESPNPIVNHLVILPDIEKRLEAFVRLGHGLVVFPGGVGTAEEILYVLGLLLCEANRDLPFPLIFTGPVESAGYFEQIDRFLRLTLGDAACARYRIIVDDAPAVAKALVQGIRSVRAHRVKHEDSFFFNWLLQVPEAFQRPFEPTHEAMAALDLRAGRESHDLAADLRRAFSGMVAGNVKADGVRRVAEHGPFQIRGDRLLMEALDGLLRSFVDQGRMKIAGGYRPCYRVLTDSPAP